jgi:hypothetical protein
MLAADNPGERMRVRDVEQALELGKFVFVHRWQMRIGEATHDQIHLAHAAPPGAKQNPAPALIERCASEGGAGHQAPFLLPVHAVSIRQQEESFLANEGSLRSRVRARAYIGRNACCQHGASIENASGRRRNLRAWAPVAEAVLT